MFGLLPHGVGRDAGVVAGPRQVGLDDLQEGAVWRNVVGVSAGQGAAVFEPRDLGLWVACRQRREAGKTFQQDLSRLEWRSDHGFSISIQRTMRRGKTQKQPPGVAWALSQGARLPFPFLGAGRGGLVQTEEIIPSIHPPIQPPIHPCMALEEPW